MEHLFSEFKPASSADWKARLEKDLKGIGFNDLQVTDRNGIRINPFYTLEDCPAPGNPVFGQPDWDICSAFTVTDEAAANKQALNALEGGASALCFSLDSIPDFSILLREIGIQYIALHFELTKALPGFNAVFLAYAATQGIAADQLRYGVGYDPVAALLHTGAMDITADQQSFLSFAQETKENLTICIDNSVVQNAGANSAYQLACCLAHVHEYLHWLDDAGLLQQVQELRITLATGTGFYEEIAKLRALRQLLPLVTGAFGVTPGIHIHATTSMVYRSRFDAYSNLLRDTIAGMAGVLGGCDSLLILPFDEQLAGDHQFGNRMSRNQQLLFKEESYMDKVADIAAGSYYMETLSAQLAEKAWEQFQAMEQAGGLIAGMTAGNIQDAVADQASQWIGEYKAGKRVLIGINKYPNATDKPVPTPAPADKSSAKGLKTISLTDEMLNS
jgi:methylmalonyl-CoA mutase